MLFDAETHARLLDEVPKMKLITLSGACRALLAPAGERGMSRACVSVGVRALGAATVGGCVRVCARARTGCHAGGCVCARALRVPCGGGPPERAR